MIYPVLIWLTFGLYAALTNWERLQRDGVLLDASSKSLAVFLCLLVLLMGPVGVLYAIWKAGPYV